MNGSTNSCSSVWGVGRHCWYRKQEAGRQNIAQEFPEIFVQWNLMCPENFRISPKPKETTYRATTAVKHGMKCDSMLPDSSDANAAARRWSCSSDGTSRADAGHGNIVDVCVVCQRQPVLPGMWQALQSWRSVLLRMRSPYHGSQSGVGISPYLNDSDMTV